MKYTHWASCLAVMFLASLPLHGQNSFAAPSIDLAASSPATASSVNEVNVLFIAMNKHGKFVRDLNKSDFSILDDHKPPQQLVRFSQQTDLPLQIGLLIDTSGSVHGRFQFEQDAAVGFLQHTLRPHYDHAFAMAFSAK